MLVEPKFIPPACLLQASLLPQPGLFFPEVHSLKLQYVYIEFHTDSDCIINCFKSSGRITFEQPITYGARVVN